MATETKERVNLFNPNNPKHVVDRGGAKFITYVGLQAKLADLQISLIGSKLEIVQNGYAHESGVWVVTVEMTFFHKPTKTTFTLQNIGDAGPNNVGKMILPHLPRMADTRARVRVLREATRSEYTAAEEIS